MLLNFIKLLLIPLFCQSLWAWQVPAVFPDAEIKTMIANFKKDERGPYQAIRWFCPDGTILPPQERCPEPGGIQHAMLKDMVTKLGLEKGVYLGQILAGIPFEDFRDSANDHSRMKQYMFEQYLQSIDDGWIMRRARFYRGAVQAEDEADWGFRFLTWLVEDDTNVQQEYFFIRQAFKMIPHNKEDKLWDRIRAISRVISDSIPAFTDIRVKLHGQPEETDLDRVIQFHKKYNEAIKPSLQMQFEQLEKDLTAAFQPIDITFFESYRRRLPADSSIGKALAGFISNRRRSADWDVSALKETASLLWECRNAMAGLKEARHRAAAFDLSISLEILMFRNLNVWVPGTLGALLDKTSMLVQAATACGYLEEWEFEHIEPVLACDTQKKQISLSDLQEKVVFTQRAVEWSSAMFRASFKEVVSLFGGFEPLAGGFIDDRIRASILLPFGITAGELVDRYTSEAGIKNDVPGLASQNQMRGLNPGYARGELAVVKSQSDAIEFSADKIYVLAQPPADLKPVAGLLTVTEGNLVSHVQLLARNLGIPNTVITPANFEELKDYTGKDVFYAVSPGGAVILKPAASMDQKEQDLFKKQVVREEKFEVPTGKMNLDMQALVNLRQLRNKHSGVLTGPKAANLGELKFLFPDQVVEGFALPFGIYRNHMDQLMPGQAFTYWQYLRQSFQMADEKRSQGVSDKDIELFILERLTVLREAIRQMPLLPEFCEDVEMAFPEILGKPMGEIPVFIRSDTNMEDLKDFTGAGLNLTVFNVRDPEKIWQGIRDVWASPFSERSYRWRQRLLLNPEDVYPSILIIPSVNVDKSGVMITTGVFSGRTEDITVAFNRGAGGAVEGQIAESWTIKPDGSAILLSPSRERRYTSLPVEGGIGKPVATFGKPVLETAELEELSQFAGRLQEKLAGKRGFENSGPLDVELGFKDGNIWLFQVRPFVESKRARSSAYLNGLDPAPDSERLLEL